MNATTIAAVFDSQHKIQPGDYPFNFRSSSSIEIDNFNRPSYLVESFKGYTTLLMKHFLAANR
jgi:hypothetical protein